MSALRVLIADDEPLARERMARLLGEAGCTVVGAVNDGAAVVQWLAQDPDVDVLFLDIQMPGLTGLEALAELAQPPMVVFVTAHPGYAVQAFEAAAVDYLLKPVYEDRLAKTLERVKARLVRRLTPGQWRAMLGPLQRFSVKAGLGWVLLDLKFVTHFALEDDKVWAYTPTERCQTQWTTLREAESLFPEAGLLRIQRHVLLRPEAVIGLKKLLGGRLKVRLAKGVELAVSRAMVPELKARFRLLVD